ncbi:MAG: MFS transporter [Cuniculiplasma sp.]
MTAGPNKFHFIFSNRYFVALLIVSSIGTMSSSLFLIGTQWYIFQQTGSLLMLSYLMFIDLFFVAFGGFFLGPFLDRGGRGNVISVSYGVRVLVFLGSFIIFVNHTFFYGDLFFIIGLLGLGSSLIYPARNSIIPDVISERSLKEGNSVFFAATFLSNIAGYVIGGIEINTYGIGSILFTALAISIPSYLLSLILRQVKGKMRNKKSNYRGELFAGARAITSSKPLIMIAVLVISWSLLFTPINAMLPAFVSINLNENSSFYGFLKSIIALGSFIGTILIGILKIKKHGKWLVITEIISGTLLILLIILVAPLYTSLIFFLVSFMDAIADILAMTISQKLLTTEVRGRAFSFIQFASQFSSLLGILLMGYIATLFSLDTIFIISGIGIVLIGAIAIFNPLYKLE